MLHQIVRKYRERIDKDRDHDNLQPHSKYQQEEKSHDSDVEEEKKSTKKEKDSASDENAKDSVSSKDDVSVYKNDVPEKAKIISMEENELSKTKYDVKILE